MEEELNQNGSHPIEKIMTTAMNSIREMIDVNTIVGNPIEASNGSVIVPISKVSFGFAAGGSEFNVEALDGYMKNESEEQIQYKVPFGGGSGAGVNINPVAFLVVQNNNVKVLSIDHISTIDKILDYTPEIINKINDSLNNKKINSEEK